MTLRKNLSPRVGTDGTSFDGGMDIAQLLSREPLGRVTEKLTLRADRLTARRTVG
jgi:hypothetical protein